MRLITSLTSPSIFVSAFIDNGTATMTWMYQGSKYTLICSNFWCGLSSILTILFAALVIESMSVILFRSVHGLILIPRYLMIFSKLAYGTIRVPDPFCNLGSVWNYVLLEIWIWKMDTSLWTIPCPFRLSSHVALSLVWTIAASLPINIMSSTKTSTALFCPAIGIPVVPPFIHSIMGSNVE